MFHAWAEISESHEAENSTPKSLFRMPDHSKLIIIIIIIIIINQTATRPADPEEAPSKPMPKPTPEHPVGHPSVPAQKDTARNSTDPQCFSIFPCRFLF